MSDAKNIAVSLRVPNTSPGKHACLIHFPGTVTDIVKAVATFGGMDGLSRHLAEDPTSLPLRLRPEDVYSGHIFGDRLPCSSILVKLTRKKEPEGTLKTPARAYAGEIVGPCIQYAYHYDSPSDMQYASPPSASIVAPPSSDPRHSEQEAHQPLMCIPPVFLRGGGTSDAGYAFEDELEPLPIHTASSNPHERPQKKGSVSDRGDVSFLLQDGRGGTACGLAKGKTWGAPKMSFQDEEPVPQPLPEILEILRKTPKNSRDRNPKDDDQEALTMVSSWFEERPIWLGGALMAKKNLPLQDKKHRKVWLERLGKVAYRFRNGPWKGAYIRRGYDPRREMGAFRYQVLQYQMPLEWWTRFSRYSERHVQLHAMASPPAVPPPPPSHEEESLEEGKHRGRTPPQKRDDVSTTELEEGSHTNRSSQGGYPYQELCCFARIPHAQTSAFQLCDLEDSNIQGEIHRLEASLEKSSTPTGVGALEGESLLNAHCSDATGWMTPATVEYMRKTVRTRFEKIYHQLGSSGCGAHPKELPSCSIENISIENKKGPGGFSSLQAYLAQLTKDSSNPHDNVTCSSMGGEDEEDDDDDDDDEEGPEDGDDDDDDSDDDDDGGLSE